MDRKLFFQKSIKYCMCSGALLSVALGDDTTAAVIDADEKIKAAEQERDFIGHWLSDLIDTMEVELDEKTRIKLIEGCGRGCFRRHQFKVDIANKGKGDIDKLVEAYKKNFEIWRDADEVHIRYGEVSQMCYCPVAKFRKPGENDLHCECTRSTHQTIFETALGRPFKVDIVESLRRGGKTCHFIVHLT